MKRYATIASLALLVTLVSSAGAFASSLEQTTSLLYAPIPTVLPYGDWEYGIRATLGNDVAKGRFFDNTLLIAPARHLEVGASWNLDRPIGPFRWGAKYELLDNQRDHDFVSLAVGVGNIVGIQRGPLAEKVNPYVVISRDFGDKLTGYAGYIHQDRNTHAIYGGLNWQWNDRLQLRAEYIHENFDNVPAGGDDTDNIFSGGLRYEWIKHVDLSPFVSHDDNSSDTVYGLEFQLHGDLRNLTTDDNEDPNRITY